MQRIGEVIRAVFRDRKTTAIENEAHHEI
jgi:hypothetical protein